MKPPLEMAGALFWLGSLWIKPAFFAIVQLMANQIIGVTFAPVAGQEATGVYAADDGLSVFETDEPYLTNGGSLQSPLLVVYSDGPTFIDSMGGMQNSLPIQGLLPPADSITWDNTTPWDNTTYWS